MTALISLEKEEFINFFVNHDCEKEFCDDIYFGINNNLNKNSKKFWDSLFHFFDGDSIYYSPLFSNEVVKKIL